MRKLANQRIREPEDHWAEEQGRRGGWGLALRSSAGFVLPIVLIIAFVLTTSGTAFLTMYTGGSKNLTARINEQKVLYCAEAGIRKAIWRMNRVPLGEWEQWATFSESNNAVTYIDSIMTLTSVGNVGDKTDTIRVEIVLDTGTSHTVASLPDGFTTVGGSGELYGPDPGEFSALPIVDANYYLGLANSVYGQPDSLVTETFINETLTDGIHFIYGDVDVKNNTVLNGTLVATGAISFSGANDISAQQVPADSSYYPAYYPAVIACGDSLSDIEGGTTNLVINGMIYSTTSIALNPVNINGPIIAPTVELAGSFTVTYDTLYALSPPGFTWPPGSFAATIGSWSN